MRRQRFVVVAAGAAALVASLLAAACAESGDGIRDSLDAALPMPEVDAAAGQGDAGADALDDVSLPPIDCTQMAFCPVPAPIPPGVTLNAIWGASANDVWVVGTRGTILHGDGSTFRGVPSGTDEILYSVWGSSAEDVWVTSSRVPRHARMDRGGALTWEVVVGRTWDETAADQGRIWAVWGSGPDDVWLVGLGSSRFGDFGSIWTKSTSFGGESTWEKVTALDALGQEIYPFVRGVWGAGLDHIWAVGYGGHAFLYEGPNEGRPGTWGQRNTRTSADLTAVWGAGRDDVWAVGQTGTIRHYGADTARAFVHVESSTNANLNAVWGSGPTDVWAVGDHGTVLHYDGVSWKLADVGLQQAPQPNLHGIWGSGPDDVWIVGDDVVLHRTKESRRLP